MRASTWAAVCLVACSYDVSLLEAPATVTEEDSTETGGVIRRGTLEVLAVLAQQAEGLLAPLGWSDGIPAAVVHARNAAVDSEFTAVTAADGVATLTDLLPGNYTIAVQRLLTPDERADAGDPDLYALGGAGSTAVVGDSLAEATVPVYAGRRGSVTVSEWSFEAPVFPGIGSYHYGGYLELHNNADTTVYVDGLTVGAGWGYINDYGPNYPCTMFEALRNDSLGIWSRWIFRFPGSGRDHPLHPGETAYVATDGIDHSAVVPGGQDLTGAMFEWIGPFDVDNPVVPNMITIGPSVFRGLGHGFFFFERGIVAYVASRLDPDTLPFAADPANATPHRRIPIGSIIDVAVMRYPSDFFEPCPQVVHRAIDRGEWLVTYPNPEGRISAHRKVLVILPDGQIILQRTGTSAVDFVNAPRSPGRIP